MQKETNKNDLCFIGVLPMQQGLATNNIGQTGDTTNVASHTRDTQVN